MKLLLLKNKHFHQIKEARMCKRKTVEHSLKGACKYLVRVLPALWLGS